VVIDAFGYLPYSGTLEIEPRGVLNLSVTLAPLGGDAPTSGSVTGVGTAKHVVVPPSALLPAGGTPVAPDPNRKQPRSSGGGSSPAPAPAPAPYRPPPPPRRDCYGEKNR